MSNISSNHRLNNISSIKTINTVCSYNSNLVALDHNCLSIKLILLIQSMLKLCHKIVKRIHLWFDVFNQFANIVVLHFSAFMMEVEPFISDFWIIDFLHNLSEGISDHSLLFLFIDQVDKNHIFILVNLFLQMLSSCLFIQSLIFVYLNSRLPF